MNILFIIIPVVTIIVILGIIGIYLINKKKKPDNSTTSGTGGTDPVLVSEIVSGPGVKVPTLTTIGNNGHIYKFFVSEVGALTMTDNNKIIVKVGKGLNKSNFYFEADGNLVLYDKNKNPVWATETNKKENLPNKLVLQKDRNLVIYDSKGKALWSSRTN